MENLPLYIPVTFAAATLLGIWQFYKAAKHAHLVLLLVFLWITVQSLITLSGFYTVSYTLPPRFLALILPPLLLILALFLSRSGKVFINSLDPKQLTLLHTVRVPVELVLYWLFLHNAVPELMTFEGRNLDILPGLSAPFIYYFGFIRKQLGPKLLLSWNVISLMLLLNIIFYGILSSPTPFQQFAFNQPNIALMYFPYVLLPGLIVPLVLFSHLVEIRRLILKLIEKRTSKDLSLVPENVTT